MFAKSCRSALIAALVAASLGPVVAMSAEEGAASKPDDAASYSLGVMFATQWREAGIAVGLSEPALLRGIHDALNGKAATDEDRANASAYLKTAYEALGAHNETVAKAFLAKNGKEPGVKTTASGLEYSVVAAGDPKAAAAGANDRVTVQYRGKLIDGTEFDSSFAHGKPSVIRPASVIPGWREVLALMPPGATWKVFVPPALGYGVSPPPTIPPNSLLVFDIEIVSIETAPAAPAAPEAATPKAAPAPAPAAAH